MAHKQAFEKLYKSGIHKTFKSIFPVRKEVGEDPFEFKQHISRKLSFDLGVSTLRTLGDFEIFSGGVPDTSSSGVTVLIVAKDMQRMLWLRLGERCYDLEIKLGESDPSGADESRIPEQKDYSHVTGDMIKAAIPKFIGQITHKRIIPSCPGGVIQERPALSHEIQFQDFEPPVVKLRLRCGAGFSPRLFASELSSELGTVGHASRLHRFAQGPFTYEEALPSYAVSFENCRNLAEKYVDRLRTYNYETRRSFSESQLKLFISDKRLYRMLHRSKRDGAKSME